MSEIISFIETAKCFIFPRKPKRGPINESSYLNSSLCLAHSRAVCYMNKPSLNKRVTRESRPIRGWSIVACFRSTPDKQVGLIIPLSRLLNCRTELQHFFAWLSVCLSSKNISVMLKSCYFISIIPKQAYHQETYRYLLAIIVLFGSRLCLLYQKKIPRKKNLSITEYKKRKRGGSVLVGSYCFFVYLIVDVKYFVI